MPHQQCFSQFLLACLRQYWEPLKPAAIEGWLKSLEWRQIDSGFIISRGTIQFCFHPAQRQSKTLHIAGENCSPSNKLFSSRSILNGKSSHFVNSQFVKIDKMGIDEVGSWQSGNCWSGNKLILHHWGAARLCYGMPHICWHSCLRSDYWCVQKSIAYRTRIHLCLWQLPFQYHNYAISSVWCSQL